MEKSLSPRLHNLLPQLFHLVTWDDLEPAYLEQLIRIARDEDLAALGFKNPPPAAGDVTSALFPPSRQEIKLQLVARSPLIVCGLPLIPHIIHAYGNQATFQPACRDGTSARPGTSLGLLAGDPQTLLSAERVILNFLQKLSGIATQTHAYVRELAVGPTRMLDTRKTTPGFRALEKYAVATGGAYNHRLGLYDRIMLKDNHLATAGQQRHEALADLVRRARESAPHLITEVEVDRLDQIHPALQGGADVILLDNFSNQQLAEAVALIGDRAFTEASGGITLERLPALATIGLDFVSSGALVHKANWADIGLDAL